VEKCSGGGVQGETPEKKRAREARRTLKEKFCPNEKQKPLT
jgi:hypothetical protein